MSVVTLTPF